MTITETYDLDNILREAEAIFQVDGSDYAERDIEVVLQNVRKRISRHAQLDLSDKKVSDPEVCQGVYREQALLFTDSVAMLHGKLCGAAQIERYLTISPISLRDINYMGYTAQSLRAVLIALQRKETVPAAEDAMQAIRNKLGTVTICREKRLFMLILIADAVGFPEIVATVAEILYQGML